MQFNWRTWSPTHKGVLAWSALSDSLSDHFQLSHLVILGWLSTIYSVFFSSSTGLFLVKLIEVCFMYNKMH